MVELIAKSPCEGLLPISAGSVSVTEIVYDAVTSVAPLKGQDEAVSAALESRIGAAFPAPNRSTASPKARVVWSGQGQAMVLGAPVAGIGGAAMTDQTDAWACVALDGADARAVLARLVPLDLRPGMFETGHAARTLLAHMTAVLMRTDKDRYEIMVFRSMAKTLVHDLKTAMEAVAARG